MATKTLLDLARRMDSLAKQVGPSASNLAVEIATNIVTQLTRMTPVDTSTALSNWVVTLGAPNGGIIRAYVVGSHGSTQASSARAALAAAKMVLKTKKPGQVIWITNNLPYIGELNRGSSHQAPVGFVQGAVAIGYNTVQKKGLTFK